MVIQLNERQEIIIEIVKKNQPVTSETIAKELGLTRGTIRPDLSILTMSGVLDARPNVGYFFTGKTSLSYVSEKIKSLKVSEIQGVPLVLDEGISIHEAIVSMFLEDVGSIFVTNKGYLTGVVSRKDLLKNAIGGIDLNKVPIGMIMTRVPNVIYITSEDSIFNAAQKLVEHEIDSLPVIELDPKDKKKIKIVGIVSKTTITRLFVELGKND